MYNAIVVKIGGSTLGSHDTTLEDLVALQEQGRHVVVVHGGGVTITDWLKVHQVSSHFVRGLRVTDADALNVVVAVLAGLINKDLVASINALGGSAFGLSGADGSLLNCRLQDAELGYVGRVEEVNVDPFITLLPEGYMPVIAPIGVLYEDKEKPSRQLLNINADTVAGEIAAAIKAEWLIFLTDVPGILDGSGRKIERLSSEGAAALRAEGTIEGGMIPKVEACLRASSAGVRTLIIDGREAHSLLAAVQGQPVGTHVG